MEDERGDLRGSRDAPSAVVAMRKKPKPKNNQKIKKNLTTYLGMSQNM